jgi:hypothetical protein
VFAAGDVAALAGALERVRARLRAGHDPVPACRARAEMYSLAAATAGLVAACVTLARPHPVVGATADEEEILT